MIIIIIKKKGIEKINSKIDGRRQIAGVIVWSNLEPRIRNAFAFYPSVYGFIFSPFFCCCCLSFYFCRLERTNLNINRLDWVVWHEQNGDGGKVGLEPASSYAYNHVIYARMQEQQTNKKWTKMRAVTCKIGRNGLSLPLYCGLLATTMRQQKPTTHQNNECSRISAKGDG